MNVSYLMLWSLVLPGVFLHAMERAGFALADYQQDKVSYYRLIAARQADLTERIQRAIESKTLNAYDREEWGARNLLLYLMLDADTKKRDNEDKAAAQIARENGFLILAELIEMKK